ncbi:MAG TPA: hypothetical protein H9925_04155 [Candidatus Phocaeicola gallinarum]|nr:hypothetical protein [Candidatus Phocaeicola gallinarum]
MKSLLPVFTLWLTLVSTFYSCQNSKPLPLTLCQVADYVDTCPDSALTVLRRMDISRMPESHCAYYAVLLAKATDKCEQSLLPCDSLLNVALNYYGDGDLEKAFALLYKSRLQGEMGERQGAIDNALKALDVLEDYPQETHCRLLLYNSLGGWYADSNLYDESLQMYQKELLYSSSLKDSVITFHDLSYIYGLKNQLDSTYYFIRKALQFAYQTGDELSIAVCLNRLSLYYDCFDEEEVMNDSAFAYAYKALLFSADCPDDETKSDIYFNIGDLYLDKKRYDSASYYLDKALITKRPDLEAYIYYSLAYLKKEMEDPLSAFRYMEKFVDLHDSLDESQKKAEIQRIVYKHLSKKQMYKEKRRTRRIISGTVILFVFTLLITIIVYQYYLNKKKRQEIYFRNQLEHSRYLLKMLQKGIDENRSLIESLQVESQNREAMILQREQVIRQLEEEKTKLKIWLFEQTPIYKKIKQLASQKDVCEKERKVLSNAEREKLSAVLFDIYQNYVSELKEKYPRLTDDDLLFLCLLQAKLEPLTIAMCFGFTNTLPINQRKYRLKEKMKP